jgi:hypothetical protein
MSSSKPIAMLVAGAALLACAVPACGTSGSPSSGTAGTSPSAGTPAAAGQPTAGQGASGQAQAGSSSTAGQSSGGQAGSSAVAGADNQVGGSAADSGGSGGSGAGAGGGATLGFSVTTNRYDNARSGANLQETKLSTANVNKASFGLLFSRDIEGQMYAQPLYQSGVKLADGTTHNLVFAATAHNMVYAFDADDASQNASIWSKSLGPSGPTNGFGCADMQPEVGVISTPVLDPATLTLYVLSKGIENGNWVQRLHALDVTSGAERAGSPVEISASVPGTGDGSNNGMVAFNPKTAMNRPGLLLQNGVVYMAWASHCDSGPYHGWVIGYSYANGQLKRERVFNISPNGKEGGIWQAGVGLSADADSIYFAAGNGSTNPGSNPPDVSESVVRLSLSDFSIKDYWTPSNYNSLNAGDSDLSSGAVLLPHDRVITGSKDGRLYLLDRTNLSKYNASGDKILQTIVTPGKANGQLGHLHGGAIYYQVPGGGAEWVFVWPEEGPLLGYQLDATYKLKTTPVQSPVDIPGHPGGFMSLSANGNQAGTAVLWAVAPQGDAWHQTRNGTLYAIDPRDITKILWSSEQNVARDGLGGFSKFGTPVVANGHVYIATFSNKLRVYGLLK